MSRIRLLVLGSTATLIVMASAIGASSASAVFTLTEAECGSGIPAFCYENATSKKLFEFSGTEEVTGKLEAGKPNLLFASFGGEDVKIECTAANFPGGTFTQTAPLTTAASISTKIDFTGCKLVEGPTTKCTIKELIETLGITGTFPEEGEIKTTTFKPTGEIFTTITFENNGEETCPATIKGTKSVKGKQTCSNITPGTDATVHLIECTTAGSELTFGENTAEFDSTFEIELKNTTDSWSIQLG
jgi:hypothetical protein